MSQQVLFHQATYSLMHCCSEAEGIQITGQSQAELIAASQKCSQLLVLAQHQLLQPTIAATPHLLILQKTTVATLQSKHTAIESQLAAVRIQPTPAASLTDRAIQLPPSPAASSLARPYPMLSAAREKSAVPVPAASPSLPSVSVSVPVSLPPPSALRSPVYPSQQMQTPSPQTFQQILPQVLSQPAPAQSPQPAQATPSPLIFQPKLRAIAIQQIGAKEALQHLQLSRHAAKIVDVPVNDNVEKTVREVLKTAISEKCNGIVLRPVITSRTTKMDPQVVGQICRQVLATEPAAKAFFTIVVALGRDDGHYEEADDAQYKLMAQQFIGLEKVAFRDREGNKDPLNVSAPSSSLAASRASKSRAAPKVKKVKIVKVAEQASDSEEERPKKVKKKKPASKVEKSDSEEVSEASEGESSKKPEAKKKVEKEPKTKRKDSDEDAGAATKARGTVSVRTVPTRKPYQSLLGSRTR